MVGSKAEKGGIAKDGWLAHNDIINFIPTLHDL